MSGIKKPKTADEYNETFDGTKDFHSFSGGVPNDAYTEVDTPNVSKSPRRIR